jgi:predicted TPR repeat methyltransferase
MEFRLFDRRGYPVVSVEAGYAEWAHNYDATVATELDEPLLNSLTSIHWGQVRRAADLACGTGRTGVWLKNHGVASIHGVDLTQQMLDVAASKPAHEQLHLADVAKSGLASSAYDLCMLVLADEHLAELEPAYREAMRLLAKGGHFVLVGYHPFFLMQGTPTHYHREGDDEPIAIQSYVHLFSEHFDAAGKAGLEVVEFRECVIDEKWLASKPKWREYLNRPVSFALVWRRSDRR